MTDAGRFHRASARNLSEGDQTRSDADQTGSDLDQTFSDADQSASDRDQRAANRDQEAADLDQATSDDAHDAGTSSSSYERTRRTRSQTTLERDTATHVRSESARRRDEAAERRDRAAVERDRAADLRDEAAAAFEAEIELLERSRSPDGRAAVGLEILLRAARDRKAAAALRARAAEARGEAARDRALARSDREHAAADRLQVAEELASEGVDYLTGALRRRVGVAALTRELDRARRTGDPIVVAFVDVDGLKAVNDERGHAAGDALLRGVVASIQHALRPYDIVMRYGGDEFVCLLSGQRLAGARSRFDRIAADIADANDGASVTVGLAEGPREGSLDELITRADDAMIAARTPRGRARDPRETLT
jgi:diguanylate cyclase (GGDEF)-like protein